MVIIGSNNSSGNAARHLSESTQALQKSLGRLSSGSKLNSASDDAAGTAVSMKFDAQVNRLQAAKDNIGNAISFHQAQDGYLQKVSTALGRMSELTIAAQDATKSLTDLDAYDLEFQALDTMVQDIATKDFNGVSLFDAAGLSVTSDDATGKFTAVGVNLGTTIAGFASDTLQTAAAAATSYGKLDTAITALAANRAQIGSNMAVLDSYSSTLSVLKDNIGAANSRIKDVDVAEESANFARQNILVQSGTAMLAQANALPQSALRLIG
jgi:flagellin